MTPCSQLQGKCPNSTSGVCPCVRTAPMATKTKVLLEMQRVPAEHRRVSGASVGVDQEARRPMLWPTSGSHQPRISPR